jgi:hypothetical protein
MRASLFALIAAVGLGLGSPAHGLESGITCDIEDDAVQPDALKELDRILKEVSAPSS